MLPILSEIAARDLADRMLQEHRKIERLITSDRTPAHEISGSAVVANVGRSIKMELAGSVHFST